MVEHGWEEFPREGATQDEIRGAVKEEADEHLRVLGTTDLLASPDFLLALRLGMFHLARSARDGWKTAFLDRLQKLFPEEPAHRIHDLALKKIAEDLKAGRDIRPPRSVIDAFYQRRQAAIQSALNV